MSDVIQIGDWTFSPSSGELRRGDERQALEDRAARLLAVLARERGRVVSQEQLIAEVWKGRALSANSVAVVIGDLRRALGDNARAPKFIETVAKRGYRLAERSATPKAPARVLFAAGAVTAAGVILIGGLMVPRLQPLPLVTIAGVANETGDARYAPLARAVGELVVRDATGAGTMRVSSNAPDHSIALSGKLILWSGHPSVSISATDTVSGEVIWSGIAPGPEDSLPGQVRELMEEFATAVEQRR